MGRIEAGKSQPSRADSFLEVDEIGERAGYHKRIGNGLAFIVADNPGRVKAVYIRNVSRDSARTEEVVRLGLVRPGAVLRGDGGGIVIGARTSIQDNCVLHTTPERPTVVGDDCVVGHLVHLEGCTVESRCLIGNGSIVMHRVVVGSGSIVAANSVVLNDTVVPPGSLAVGSPAVVKEGRANPALIDEGVAAYVRRTAMYRDQLRRLD